MFVQHLQYCAWTRTLKDNNVKLNWKNESEANSGHIGNSCRLVEAHPIDESEANAEDLKKWVKSVRQPKKRVSENNRLDIRNHILLS